jgi:hypothetical protein
MAMQQFSTNDDVWNEADEYIQSTLPGENTIGLNYDEDDIVDLYEKPVREIVSISNTLSYCALEVLLTIEDNYVPLIEKAFLQAQSLILPNQTADFFAEEYDEWQELLSAFIVDCFAECSIDERLEFMELGGEAIEGILLVSQKLYALAHKVLDLAVSEELDAGLYDELDDAA